MRRVAGCLAAGVSSVLLGQAAQPIFEDVTAATGLAFEYRNGSDGTLHLPELMGAGVALVDYDNDGDLDLYLVQGGRFGPQGQPLPGATGDRLLRNDLTPGGPRFVDVSDALGLKAAGYGMGAATGDYDNDGWTDVLVTGYGSLRLLRNVEGRRLDDVTAQAGLRDEGWSVSASFVDFDRDGWLDLYLARYVDYRPVRCALPSSRPDYCGPKSFTPQRDRLFRNAGLGRFEERSDLLGPHKTGAGLGVAVADYDADGWLDIYVANDGSDNHLWLNQAGRGFRDEGLLAGVALSRLGVARAGMGTDAGDLDADGDLDLAVTHLMTEAHGLFVNQGDAVFDDRSAESGLAQSSLALTGFGAHFLDFDSDGALDLAIVNGGVHLSDAPRPALEILAQPKLLLRGDGAGHLMDLTITAAPGFARPEVTRGLAVGDVDNDGDPDLLLGNILGPARLWLDTIRPVQPWLGLRLLTSDGRRDALGALASLRRRGAAALVRHVHTDGSYASASDPRLLFGLARGHDVEALDIRWPDGARESFDPPALRTYTTLRQGQGRK